MFGSREGDIAGEGLAQAMSEVREVQQDTVGGLTCRGETPETHTNTHDNILSSLIMHVINKFIFKPQRLTFK